jgi:hypothetical protein
VNIGFAEIVNLTLEHFVVKVAELLDLLSQQVKIAKPQLEGKILIETDLATFHFIRDLFQLSNVKFFLVSLNALNDSSEEFFDCDLIVLIRFKVVELVVPQVVLEVLADRHKILELNLFLTLK